MITNSFVIKKTLDLSVEVDNCKTIPILYLCTLKNKVHMTFELNV